MSLYTTNEAPVSYTHLPGWEESDFDNILADRDHLLNKVPDLPSNGEEICETITTTRPPQTDFAVCEETTVGSSTQSCFEGWTEKLDVSTLFECIARTGKKLTVECLADYNETSQDYTCLHTPPQTCHVGEKVEIQSTYQYRCKTDVYKRQPQASSLLVARFTMKLHRSGLQWAAYGEKGQCGPYLEPIMDKRVYRTQMMYPSRTTGKQDGRCCYPMGASTSLWHSGKTWASGGEDAAYLIYRKRDCCQGAGIQPSLF